MVEMQTRSELSMNDQSGSATSSINAFTSYPLSLRMVESNTAPSRGIGNLLKICRPGEPASINETLLITIVLKLYSRNLSDATLYLASFDALQSNRGYPHLQQAAEVL